MKRFFIYILFLFSTYTFANNCNDYKQEKVESIGGEITVTEIDSCTWVLFANSLNGYKFAYWKNLYGTIIFENEIQLEIDTTIQNYLYEATFIRDNAFIYKWLDDSIIIRTDTTDLLSGLNTAGWSYTLVDDEIRMTDEDERITKLDWGVWKSDVSEVINNNEYAGKTLHMIIHNSCGKPSAVIDTIIPVVIHDTMYAHTMNFHSTIPHTDLQVLEDAVLYVDSNIIINGILDIHEGGKVIINENKTLEAQGIILRGNGITQKWAQLLIKGTVINNSEDLIFYDYTVDDNQYYPLSLPDTVQCTNIISSITGLPTNYTSYLYNTALRNTHASGWELFNNNISSAHYILGNGYIMWADPNQWKNIYAQKTNIIRYPIRVNLSNEKENKFIHVYGDTDKNIRPSDKNWNLIGNPYLSNYTIGPESNIIEILPKDEEEINYITYSDDGYLTYKQERSIGFILKPFNSYFIQTIDNGEIEFERHQLQQHYSPKRIKQNNRDLQIGITLTQNDRIENIGLLYGDYTDEYEINADLAKMFGNAPVLYAYSLLNEDPLAFQAISIDSIYSIPIGYRNAKISQMTFAFDNKNYIFDERLSGIWLYDLKLNNHTNLLNDEYVFTPTSSKEDNRFYITIELKSNISTNIDNVNVDYKNFIFDVLGRRVSNTYKNGVYIIFKNEKYNKAIK